MRLVNLGLGNINSTVGAFAANTDRCLEQARAMAEAGVTVALFPEQVIGGYPAEDLIQWQGFVEHQWTQLQRFAVETESLPLVSVIGVAIAHHGLRYNCAAVVAGGQILGLVPKEKLPTYGIYYDGRTMARGSAGMRDLHNGVPFGDLLFRFDFGILAAEVCEDLWSPDGPMRRRAYAGAELVVNLSASVFRVGIGQTRQELIATRAADHQVTVAYVNAVGANDGLIFDGGGYVNQNGRFYHTAPRFQQGWTSAVIDLDRTLRLRTEATTWRTDQEEFAATAGHPPTETITIPAEVISTVEGRSRLRYPVPPSGSFFLPAEQTTPPPSPREVVYEEILDALALGIGDYYEKLGVFKRIGVSLSGGRDSLLTLLIAHRYANKVTNGHPGQLMRAFYQPSRFSSDETRIGAQTICEDLGIPFEIISIDEAFTRELDAVEHFLGDDAEVTELTRQNIQARLRAQRMWNWSNSSGGLFLQTGNMSEKAVGYTTIGGDLTGALAVLANVPKTVVMALLAYIQEKEGYPGIAAVLKKPAGPELAHNQAGEDELMPFFILDACFYLFAGEKMLPEDVLAVVETMYPDIAPEVLAGYVDKFTRLFLQSIYKWVQSPLALHIGNLDLERERALQLPVVTSRAWTKG
ncbi:MAG: NAD(+) synthase [Thermomicrobiales bacterium]